MEVVLFTIAVVFVIGIISWIHKMYEESEKYKELKPRLDKLDVLERQHEANVKTQEEKFKKEREELETIVKQKSMAFPWLVEAFADYYSLADEQKENYLKNKSHPAYSSAEVVKGIKKEKRELLRIKKIVEYKNNYYEKLFPWLQELIAETEDEEIPVGIIGGEVDEDDSIDDRSKNFLTPEEYAKLPSVERNQKALDRYLQSRNKSRWAIGRDYEMYVGYLYEQNGYQVEYKGIVDGFDDLGRDIIAVKGNEVCIIQCKYWAQYKEIHEKHIFQLFGTTMEYWIKNFNTGKKPKTFAEFAKFLNEEKLRPIFFTSTAMSNKAKEMAAALSIEIIEKTPIAEFPRIKCNISGRDSERIYHLPFDQQYDRTIIEKKKGESCVFTVKQAETAGFRRAFKHRY